MGKTTLAAVLTLGALAGAGCNPQDKNSLARIGEKIAERSEEATSGLREKLSHGLPDMGNLHERVHRRVKWDKGLEGAVIDLKVSGTEVELKGTVKTPEQRRRAVDLVENTIGVEKIQDNLKVENAEPGI